MLTDPEDAALFRDLRARMRRYELMREVIIRSVARYGRRFG